MYVVDAIGKQPYYDFRSLPPYGGPCRPPVLPGPDGHFDHLHPGSREFLAAHMYGTVRFVLDVWENYFGRTLPWHFAQDYRRLELIPLVEWNNAHCGYGFIETGFARLRHSEPVPFGLNFDVLAHEVAHAFTYTLLGTPPVEAVSGEYLAFHEAASDCSAIVAVLQFESVIDRLLERTHGNIYMPNELNRIGELSETKQIRLASQSLTLSDVPDIRTPVWQLTQRQRHDMSLPLTGCIFDVLVELFQDNLVAAGLIDDALDKLSHQADGALFARVQAAFDEAYAGRHDGFKRALLDARDHIGRCLAHAWQSMSWDLSYEQWGAALIDADERLYAGAGGEILLESLTWRGIDAPLHYGRNRANQRNARALRKQRARR